MKFDEIMTTYRTEVLEEEPQVPVQPQGAPTQGGIPEPQVPEEPQPDPEDVVNKLSKESKIPWVDVAGVLARAIEYNWSDDDIEKINEIGGTQTLIIELSVEKADIGKIIGKKGKTINAIRTLLMSVASRNGIRVSLEILEENGEKVEA